jgi:hypothetical protein
MRLLFLLGIFLSTTAFGAAGGWHSFRFDGSGFAEGSGKGAILVRDGYLPVQAADGAPREDPLPAGTGAVALLCYQQVSGGKLQSQAGYRAIPGAALSVHGAAVTLAARVDAGGYLILALPAGSYEFKAFGFTKRVNVVQGKNALVSIRGGKRMVD